MLEKPSKVTDQYWVSEIHDWDYVPELTGKWLLFIPLKQLDAAWEVICKATMTGKLGFASKAATAKLNPNASDPNIKVICVYTRDYSDVSDVKRVREQLRKLGFTAKIPYKTDYATARGKYVARGNTRISMYYE